VNGFAEGCGAGSSAAAGSARFDRGGIHDTYLPNAAILRPRLKVVVEERPQVGGCGRIVASAVAKAGWA
jgi:hypothetical protein